MNTRRPVAPCLVALLFSCLLVPALPSKAGAQEPPAAEKQSKYPRPDLAEVEKHFQVVSYNYDDAKERLIVKLVPLVASVPQTYKVLFYDAGGERIDSGYTLHYYNTVVGEPMTCDIGIPKRVMDRATKAVISR